MLRGSAQQAMHVVICPNHFWMQQMCNEVMCTMTDAFHRIPDLFKHKKCVIKQRKKPIILYSLFLIGF